MSENEIETNTEQTENAEFVRFSKIRKLFVAETIENKEKKEIKLRISGDAKFDVMRYLDEKVKQGVMELVSLLPRTSKGENKGSLKRVTITKDDVEKAIQKYMTSLVVLDEVNEESDEE